jgi:hypothetical protein
MKKAVMCVVPTRLQAEAVVEELHSIGFPSHEISVLFLNSEGAQVFVHEHGSKAPEGAIAGVSSGGVLGGTLGLLAGIGALAIPGLGPFIAAGPLLAALGGAAAGATLGGVTGALIGLGIPEIEAKRYEGKLKGGHHLISVHTESSEERKRAEDVYKRAKAEDICAADEASTPSPKGRDPHATV